MGQWLAPNTPRANAMSNTTTKLYISLTMNFIQTTIKPFKNPENRHLSDIAL